MTQIGYDQVQPGWEVYGSDSEHLGSVTNVNDTYITMSKGLFLPKDYYIPASGIATLDAGQEKVVLSVAKGDLDRMGWDNPAVAEGDHATSAERAYGTMNETQGAESHSDTQRVQRYEEELRAEKSSRQTGEVRLHKDVAEEEQAFDVPVTREDVEVRRVAVNRPAGEAEEAFGEGDTLRIPVREEQVQVTKEPRVVEEIEIRKTPRQDTERVSDTVRKEQVNVERQGDVSVRGDRELTGAGADRFEGQGDWDRPDPAMESRGTELGSRAFGSDDSDESHVDDDDLGDSDKSGTTPLI